MKKGENKMTTYKEYKQGLKEQREKNVRKHKPFAMKFSQTKWKN